MMYWGWGMGLVGVLVVLGFVALCVLGAVWLATRMSPSASAHTSSVSTTPPPPAETPLDVAKRRYASGEITKAEYDQIREDLQR